MIRPPCLERHPLAGRFVGHVVLFYVRLVVRACEAGDAIERRLRGEPPRKGRS